MPGTTGVVGAENPTGVPSCRAPSGAPLTDPVMPKPFFNPSPSLWTGAITTRPEVARRSPAKAISRVDPAVLVTHAADPAVLVNVHADQRLSLGQLQCRMGRPLSKWWSVLTLATGHIVLACDLEPDEAFIPAITLDGRQRLRLPDCLLQRLAVPIGGQVLITAAPDALGLRLINHHPLQQGDLRGASGSVRGSVW